MSPLRRRALVVTACGLGALAATGCRTTQDQSAALKAKATAVDAPGRVQVGRPDPEARVVARHELRAAAATAVVVEVENRGPRALLRVPVVLRLQAGGKQLYANDGEGNDELLLRIPVIPPRSRVTWVNANVPAAARGATLDVVLGAATRRSRRPAAALRVTRLRRSAEDSGSDGVAVTGTVHNGLKRAQTEVPVYVTARRGSRIVAAGATRVGEIAAGRSAPFEAVLIGDGRSGRLTADALPTKLQTTRTSR